MIGTIRRHQQWLWGVIILAIIISFVVYFSPNSASLMDDRGGYNFGTINNRPITRDEYRAAYTENELLYFLRSGGKWPSREEAESPSFNGAIYGRIAFTEKLKGLKVEPTVEATAKWISDIFNSPNDPTPAADRYQSFVKNDLAPRRLTSEDFYRFARHQVAQEHWLLAPADLYPLPRRDLGDIDLDRGERQHVRRRAHLADQRQRHRDRADAGKADRGDVDDVAAAEAVIDFHLRGVGFFQRGHAHP